MQAILRRASGGDTRRRKPDVEEFDAVTINVPRAIGNERSTRGCRSPQRSSISCSRSFAAEVPSPRTRSAKGSLGASGGSDDANGRHPYRGAEAEARRRSIDAPSYPDGLEGGVPAAGLTGGGAGGGAGCRGPSGLTSDGLPYPQLGRRRCCSTRESARALRRIWR